MRRIDGDALVQYAKDTQKALYAEGYDEILSFEDVKKMVDELAEESKPRILDFERLGEQQEPVWIQIWISDREGGLTLEEGWGMAEKRPLGGKAWVVFRQLREAGHYALAEKDYGKKKWYGFRCWNGKPTEEGPKWEVPGDE